MNINKFYAIAVGATAVFAVALFSVFSLTRPAIESFPLDWGWVGFVFIFGNGFFLSYYLLNRKVGVLDRLLLTLGLGFGITFIIMILLGVLWQITLTTVLSTHVILLVALGVIALRRGLKLPRFTFEPKNIQLTKQNILQAFLLAIIGILAFTSLYNTLSLPPTEWDSLAYGVNYAKIIYQNSHIPLIAGPSIGIEMSAPYPPGTQLAATFLYVFAGSANDFYYRLLPPIFSMATLLEVYKFTREVTKNRTVSVFAASALAIIPYFWELFILESYLMVLTFLVTMSSYFLYKAYAGSSVDQRKLEIVGSIFCGFAALTSYIGLFAFGILLVYSAHKKVGLKRFGGLVGVAACVALPWYLRNLVLLGSPVYPFGGIGKYLDPLLHSLTSMHFQQYQLLPEYTWALLAYKVCIVFLVIGVVLFSLSNKRKDFPLTLALYLLLVSLSLMAFYVGFPRYLLIALPTTAVFFGFAFNMIPKRGRWPKTATAVFLVLVVVVSVVMLSYVNNVKPPASTGETQAQYIAQVYAEGAAWQWINQNTPADTKVASYDIKEYYLNRTLFSLDGNEAVPLYHMESIQEAMQYLKDKGVGYFLSVPWASLLDNRLPPAYTRCIITRYLGDPNYFPPVYVDNNGTTIYHVGAFNDTDINKFFPADGIVDVVAPLKQKLVTLPILNMSTTNDTRVCAVCYIPLPVDYGKGNITVTVMSTAPLDLELWKEKIPEDQLQELNSTAITDRNSDTYMIENSNFTSVLSWQGLYDKGIDNVGYFTIRVLDRIGNFTEPNVTLDIHFYNLYDLASS